MITGINMASSLPQKEWDMETISKLLMILAWHQRPQNRLFVYINP